ncbi:MAG: redoxin domain-containing protein [Acidimicrobiia bacterium]|nr:redoxin domain-containing protein [Acidimicrobiia bacterium]
MAVEIGSPAPDFSLRDQHRNRVSVADFRGNKTLIVFIPWAFSGVCTDEACELRDKLSMFNDLDTNVAVITTDSFFTNAAWAAKEGLEYPVLADFWPHGAVAQAYGTFNDKFGVATRSTFVLDEEGIVRDIISSDNISQARDHEAYRAALAAI